MTTRPDLQRQADELYDVGVKLTTENGALGTRIAELVKTRMEILAGQSGESSPAAKLAFDGLRASDAATASAGHALVTAGDDLAKAMLRLRDAIGSAGRTYHEPTSKKSGGNLRSEDEQQATENLINLMELGPLFIPMTIGATLVFYHVLLIGIHDANASYLNRKAYERSKLLHSGIALLEGAGEDALHFGVIFGAHIIGVAAPHVLLLGTLLAGVRVAYRFTQSQVEDAKKSIAAATDVFAKMFAFQQLNEQCAQSALIVRDLVVKAKDSADVQSVDLRNAETQLREARLGINELLRQVEDLRRLEALIARIKSGG